MNIFQNLNSASNCVNHFIFKFDPEHFLYKNKLLPIDFHDEPARFNLRIYNSVKDPQSGERLSLAEAVGRKIFDPAKQSTLQRAFNIGEQILWLALFSSSLSFV